MKTNRMPLFAPCPKGLEYLLRDELIEIGAKDAREVLAGVSFSGDMALAMRACLHSRLASRILLVLCRFAAEDATAVYEAAKELDWPNWLGPNRSFVVDISGSAPGIAHTGFAALRVKDAIIDSHRTREVERPNVDAENPDVRLRLYLHPKEAAIMWDFSGAPLHERGWRTAQGEAPIKENLAAALLIRGKWPERAARGEAFVDPMCGAGTILMEAVAMAADVAPGLKRAQNKEFGYYAHPSFDPQAEAALVEEARSRADTGLKALGLEPRFFGFDADPQMLAIAKRNLQVAAFAGFVRLAQGDAAGLKRPIDLNAGLVLSNPPYGERMGDARQLHSFYRAYGAMLAREFSGFGALLISSDRELLSAVNLPITKRYALKNGALDCTLAIYDTTRPPREDAPERGGAAQTPKQAPLSDGAQMVANRIQKNQRRLKSYLSDQKLECYRIYDADLPEYSAAVDVYGSRLHIQEYLAPIEIPEATAAARLRELVAGAQAACNVAREQIFLKTRKRDKGGSKYRRDKTNAGEYFEVSEGNARFWINLEDFLDSGLFLDSRMLRQRIFKRAQDLRFLNLFCYTASASVYAALGGAKSSLSIDLSPTYTHWAQQNFELNGLDPKDHEIEQADALEWLNWAVQEPDSRGAFDLIYLDPPTFSNSKRTDSVLDIQRDHRLLIEQCMHLLSDAGELIFVTNAQKFKLDPELHEAYALEDISAKTLPPDFERHPKIHRAFALRRNAS